MKSIRLCLSDDSVLKASDQQTATSNSRRRSSADLDLTYPGDLLLSQVVSRKRSTAPLLKRNTIADFANTKAYQESTASLISASDQGLLSLSLSLLSRVSFFLSPCLSLSMSLSISPSLYLCFSHSPCFSLKFRKRCCVSWRNTVCVHVMFSIGFIVDERDHRLSQEDSSSSFVALQYIQSTVIV